MLNGLKEAIQAAVKLLQAVETAEENGRPLLVKKDKLWKAENLDDGIYKDAAREKKTVTELLTEKEYEAGFGDGDGDEVSAYYNKSQREISEIRMKARLRGETPPLTVVEKQMLHAGISRFDMVEKFFTVDSSLRTLFPEVIVQDVQDGLILLGLVSQLAAERVPVPYTDAIIRAWKIDDTALDQDALQLRRVAKGAEIPKTKVTASERSLQLGKFARMLQMAYEDMAGMKIDVFTRILRRMGLRINVDETDDLLATLQSGDASSGAPTNVVNPATSGAITLADLLKFWSALPAPFRATDLIGRKTNLLTYFTTLMNAAGASGFVRTGETPYQRPRELEWDRAVIASDKFVVIDRNNAITWYESPVLSEEDKIIRKQLREATIGKIAGAKIEELGAIAIVDVIYP